MECAEKGDDARATGKGARDFDRIFDRFGARRHKHRAIFFARVDKRVQPLRERDVALMPAAKST
jgi:hypothetical protein